MEMKTTPDAVPGRRRKQRGDLGLLALELRQVVWRHLSAFPCNLQKAILVHEPLQAFWQVERLQQLERGGEHHVETELGEDVHSDAGEVAVRLIERLVHDAASARTACTAM